MTFYTVLLNKDGFPVKYADPSDQWHVKRFGGASSDPGEASQEFCAQAVEPCYLDERTFQAKVRALADQHQPKRQDAIPTIQEIS